MSLFYIPDKIYDKKEVSPLHLPKSLGDLSRSMINNTRKESTNSELEFQFELKPNDILN